MTPVPPMIEKVARAIYAAKPHVTHPRLGIRAATFEEAWNSGVSGLEAEARAAIEAMREPTEEMEDAARGAWLWYGELPHDNKWTLGQQNKAGGPRQMTYDLHRLTDEVFDCMVCGKNMFRDDTADCPSCDRRASFKRMIDAAESEPVATTNGFWNRIAASAVIFAALAILILALSACADIPPPTGFGTHPNHFDEPTRVHWFYDRPTLITYCVDHRLQFNAAKDACALPVKAGCVIAAPRTGNYNWHELAAICNSYSPRISI